MDRKTIREKFVEMYGQEQYNRFVLTLYDSFPLRDKLFYWQEQMLNDFCEEINLEMIDYENTYSVFNQCPLHGDELNMEIVPIVDGNTYPDLGLYQTSSNLFPLSNVNAPRDLERFSYPEEVEVYYCEECRKVRLALLAELVLKNNYRH